MEMAKNIKKYYPKTKLISIKPTINAKDDIVSMTNFEPWEVGMRPK